MFRTIKDMNGNEVLCRRQVTVVDGVHRTFWIAVDDGRYICEDW